MFKTSVEGSPVFGVKLSFQVNPDVMNADPESVATSCDVSVIRILNRTL